MDDQVQPQAQAPVQPVAQAQTQPQVPVQAVPQVQSVRPWQGTLMAILSIIVAVLLGVLLTLAIVGGAMVGVLTTALGLPSFISASVFLLPIAVIALFVAMIFIIIGFFKGKRLWVIVSLVVLALSILSSLSDPGFFSLALNGFFVYLHIICLNNSFYK